MSPPEAVPATAPPAVVETHIATVVFLGGHAYKVKKPVRFDFLDFSTVEARRAACLREVELNRRFSPDVYLGVAEVTGPDGEVCDHLVVMRRLDPGRRLSALVRRDDPAVPEQLRQVARILAAWHARAPRGPEIDAEGGVEALARRWRANLAETGDHGLPGADEIAVLAERYLAGRRPLLEARVAAGRIVDGHGDLIADDVFRTADGPRVLDCLEFDDRLRYVDGLDDAAFLAMDLDRLNAPEAARSFLDSYLAFSGDTAPATLCHHYIAYRAYVRAKVAALGDREAQAADYADVALRHLRAGDVKIVLVGGLPGTGKTTVSGALAERLGWAVLSSDRLRKELAGRSPLDPAPAEFREGLYDAGHTERTYSALLDRAEALAAHGESVILDASWTDPARLRDARDTARRAHASLTVLECRTSPEIARARIRDRAPGASDATAATAAAMAEHRPPPGIPMSPLDTGLPVEATVTAAVETIFPHGSVPRRPVRPRLAPD